MLRSNVRCIKSCVRKSSFTFGSLHHDKRSWNSRIRPISYGLSAISCHDVGNTMILFKVGGAKESVAQSFTVFPPLRRCPLSTKKNCLERCEECCSRCVGSYQLPKIRWPWLFKLVCLLSTRNYAVRNLSRCISFAKVRIRPRVGDFKSKRMVRAAPSCGRELFRPPRK